MLLFWYSPRRYFTLKANFVLSHLANIDFFPPSAFQIELKQARLVLFNTFKGAEPPLAIWNKNPQLWLVLYGYSNPNFLLFQSFNSCLKEVQCILLQRWQERYCILYYHTWSQYIPCCLLCLGVWLDVSMQVLQWWPKIVIHRDKLLGASRIPATLPARKKWNTYLSKGIFVSCHSYTQHKELLFHL